MFCELKKSFWNSELQNAKHDKPTYCTSVIDGFKGFKIQNSKMPNLMNLPNVSQTLMVLDSLLFFVMLF
jgi:hypothetical protein